MQEKGMFQRKPKKLKRAVIKEELVSLVGDAIKAVILQQFIYWSERVNDFDKFIMEESARAETFGYEIKMPLTNGWIYKKAAELSEETMLGLKDTAMREHIKSIVNMGYLDQRNNPHDKRDRTLQYRVNLLKVQLDLMKLGYVLEGYEHPIPVDMLMEIINKLELEGHAKSLNENAFTENELATLENENANSENGIAQPCGFQSLTNSYSKNAIPESENAIPLNKPATLEKREALPETTTEKKYLIIDDHWKQIQNAFKTSLSDQQYQTWIEPLEVLGMENDVFLIKCPNEFSLSWVSERYLLKLKEAVNQYYPGLSVKLI